MVVSCHSPERLLSFDTDRYPLRELVQGALKVDDIEKLHCYEPEEFLLCSSVACGSATGRSALRRVELLRHALKERWKGSTQRKQWEHDYLPRLVREVIGPKSMASETRLLFQRSPLLRFHVAWPVSAEEEVAEYEPIRGFGKVGHSHRPPGCLAMLHKDRDTGHPPSEVNFLLPVTLRTYGTNSLWVESEPDLCDYRPFEMSYGEMMQWRGNSLHHYSHRNTCDDTRVSFDFRVIPGSEWEPPQSRSLFQLGSYYLDALAPVPQALNRMDRRLPRLRTGTHIAVAPQPSSIQRLPPRNPRTADVTGASRYYY